MRWWKDGLFCAAGGVIPGLGIAFSFELDPWLCAAVGALVLGVLGAIYGLGSLMWVTVGGLRG